jgi:hypothetical protein
VIGSSPRVVKGGIGVDVRVLGPLEVEAGGRLVRLGPQQRRVFLALLLQMGQAVSGIRLGELVWGEPVPECGAATLRSHVMRLRRALHTVPSNRPGEIALVTQSGGYALRVCPDRMGTVGSRHFWRRAGTLWPPETHGLLVRCCGRGWGCGGDRR